MTRARRSLTLIRSLRPDQITATSEGASLLRRFLEYAQDPVRAFEKAIDVDPAAETESPFEEAVYRALTQRGYQVSAQVGCFGYRIDLAIAAEDGSRYDLGIECDGAAYHRAPAARDRDWLRQSVLEGLGWAIHRIWSTDWIRDPEAQIQSIEHALRSARALSRDARVEGAPLQQVASAGYVAEQGDTSKLEDGRASKAPQEFRFTPYKLVELVNRYSKVPIVEERPQRLYELVIRIVEAEGPVHVDVMIDRIRRHYGSGRAGAQIQSVILTAVDSARRDGHICWRVLETTNDPESRAFLDVGKNSVRPEPRGMTEDGNVRRIEHIWPGEIEAGVLRVVETAFGASRKGTISAVARAFGYDRSGSNIQEAILAAIEHLIKSGELIEGAGGLTLVH